MNSNQIRKILWSDIEAKNVFRGVFAVDQLPRELQVGAYIINTDEHYKPGQHWVAVYYDGTIKEYFDSYGLPPLDRRILEFLGPKFVYNNIPLQKTLSNACGYYCVYYILRRSRAADMEKIVRLLERTKDSDYYVKSFIYKRYKCIILRQF